MSDRLVRSLASIVASMIALVPAGALAQDEGAIEASAVTEGPVEPRLGRSTTTVTPSVQLAYGAGLDDELGIGLRLRLDHYPSRTSIRFGGFVDAEVQTDGSVRVAGGLANGMWLFGCELGVAYRADTGRYTSSVGLHIGKSILLGPVTIGGRITIPLIDFLPAQDDGQRAMGLEGQVVLTVGLPTTLDGPERNPFDCGHHARGRSSNGLETETETEPSTARD